KNLLHQAVLRGYTARLVRAADMLADLARQDSTAALTRRIRRYIAPTVLGIDRPIWFGGADRSEASMDEFYRFLGEKKARNIRLAVMDMWKAFRNSTTTHAPQAAILFDKFHVLRHLG